MKKENFRQINDRMKKICLTPPKIYVKWKYVFQFYWMISNFIYGGERRLREGDIEILTIRDALKELSKILSH